MMSVKTLCMLISKFFHAVSNSLRIPWAPDPR
jgi:hypothetical protein